MSAPPKRMLTWYPMSAASIAITSASLGAIVGSVEFDMVTTACVAKVASTTLRAVLGEALVTGLE